jgi:hypothetical protein
MVGGSDAIALVEFKPNRAGTKMGVSKIKQVGTMVKARIFYHYKWYPLHRIFN